ncbi:hypothetical protein CGLO_06430 [Colletotrichum gloeosporioides Cg-14]|uniref:Uncharacterized protein n=1 Tax=Colletotrichum gloeosporioides (strain Cg-14) TaxID=1237896 RepID=T0LQ51_COLGC|nr:hypothetical protein CGLO_06430 [Colletotrichum gloeosporioides Cg-14]
MGGAPITDSGPAPAPAPATRIPLGWKP